MTEKLSREMRQQNSFTDNSAATSAVNFIGNSNSKKGFANVSNS
jgi:hypothetical protein